MPIRAAMIAMVVACAHPSSSSSPPPKAAPSVTQAAADAAQANTATTNEARFTAALAASKLEAVTLESVGLGPQSIEPTPGFTSGEVTTAEVRGARVSVLGVYEASCGGVPTELARRGNQIVRINRRHTPGTTTALTVHGCPQMNVTCGGMRPTMMPVGYVLPAGTTYGGVVEVAYAADEVTVGPDHPCPYAPPPP